MSMNKYSGAQVGSVMKLAAENLRALSEENQELKQKVAHFEKKERAEKIASVMETKRLEPESTFTEKVASLMQRDNLDTVEEAVGLIATQEKLASVSEDFRVAAGGGDTFGDQALDAFAANLASI